jgi:hypothetical protein
VQNLLYVLRFTSDNFVSMEFDPFGLSVKDYRTKEELLRCNSSGDLYRPAAMNAVILKISILWHRRLGHPGDTIAFKKRFPRCNKPPDNGRLCHACQIENMLGFLFLFQLVVQRRLFS